ncbi:O-fucosyltransferase 7-like isoform X2 [Wolffia australiana]
MRGCNLGSRTLSLLRRLLIFAIGAITVVAILAGHFFPSSRPPGRAETARLEIELVHENYSRDGSKQFDAGRKFSKSGNLWILSPHRNTMPCLEQNSSYTPPSATRGYLVVHTNGGLNQMRMGISDMVAIARIINATLSKVAQCKKPKNLKTSFHTATSRMSLMKNTSSWSNQEYYTDEISQLWNSHQVIKAAKSDSRLANNNLSAEVQKLRCHAFFEALQFAPRIKAFGNLLVKRMRSHGRYIALHLRYEKDMLAFSGCTYGLSPEEADELTKIRESTPHWTVKDIDPLEQRAKGYCPLTPKEVGILLSAMGYPSNTPIYVAAGEIYGGQVHMADLQAHFPMLLNKEMLSSPEELKPFTSFASQMAALDYIVSVESDVFVPSYSGNMARAVAGHRRFLGHRKTISPDRKALVILFNKIERGKLREGKNLSKLITSIHRKRQGSPRKRRGPISGTRGKERFRSEEAFYENPLPDCICPMETPRKR